MVNEFVDLPTEVLLDLVIGILDVERLLTSKDVAELEDLQYEIQTAPGNSRLGVLAIRSLQ